MKDNIMSKSSKAVSAPMATTSKQAQLLEALKRPDGATIEEMTKLTGWQAHSVRGVISGQFRKKQGLIIAISQGTYGTVYRLETVGK